MEMQTMNTTATQKHPTNAIVASVGNSTHPLMHERIAYTPHTPITMSSLEIAKLTNKTHKNVIRDIKSMLADLPDGSDLIHVETINDSRGYTTEIRLDRDLTQTLVTGYSVPLRLAVIQRLNALETQAAKPTPASLDNPFALRELLLGYTEKVILLEQKVAEDAPKVDFFEDVAVANNCHTMKQTADILGTGRNSLFKYLRQNKILISDGKNHNLPYQAHKDAGRFIVIETTYKNPHSGQPMLCATTYVTGKGLIWLQQFIAKHGREGL